MERSKRTSLKYGTNSFNNHYRTHSHCYNLIVIFRPRSNSDVTSLQSKVLKLQNSLTKIEANLKEDFRINWEESATIA